MFSNSVVDIVVGGLLLVAIIAVLYNLPQAKAARSRRAEEERRWHEQMEKRDKEKVEREAKLMEKLRQQRFIVCIREKDERKSSFEAVLIKELIKQGITVESIPRPDVLAIAGGDVSLLKDGQLAIVGTSWRTTETHRTEEGMFGSSVYQTEKTHCDYRLLTRGDGREGKGQILGAGYESEDQNSWGVGYEKVVAEFIVKDLATNFSKSPQTVRST